MADCLCLGGGGARLPGVFVYILVGRRQAVWSICLYFGGEAPGCLEYLFTCDVTVTWSEVGGACHVTGRGGDCYSPIGHVVGRGRGQQSPIGHVDGRGRGQQTPLVT
jgi:hypothetical protein